MRIRRRGSELVYWNTFTWIWLERKNPIKKDRLRIETLFSKEYNFPNCFKIIKQFGKFTNPSLQIFSISHNFPSTAISTNIDNWPSWMHMQSYCWGRETQRSWKFARSVSTIRVQIGTKLLANRTTWMPIEYLNTFMITYTSLITLI